MENKPRIFAKETYQTQLAYKTLKIKVNNLKLKQRNHAIKHDKTDLALPVSKAKNRNEEKANSVILKTPNPNALSGWNALYGLLVLVFCILASFPLILVPQHDGIRFPQYWYELMISTNLTTTVSWTFAVLLDGKYLLKVKALTSLRACIWIYIVPTLFFDVCYCITYVIWTNGFGYNYPVPFTNAISYINFIPCSVAIWYQFPRTMRTNKEERRKIHAFLLCYCYSFLMHFQNNCINVLLRKIPPNLQWILAVVFPITRELNIRLLNKLAKRAAACEDLEYKANVSISVNIIYSSFIAITIGSTATTLTSYFILTMEFLHNLYSCWKITKMNRKIEHNEIEELKGKNKEALVMLTITEVIEILVPMATSITFLLAFYGPNASILGNIQNSYWDYEMVDDIGQVLSGAYQMFFFDTASIVVGGLILWKFSKINILRECCKVLKRFWPIIAVRMANQTVKV